MGTGSDTTSHARHVKGKGKGVILVGRREGTVKVLNEEIADLVRTVYSWAEAEADVFARRQVRPHLPALIKLPRHWTLLYSLDQHGISLNTLYARCEPRIPSRAHPNPPKGGLLVVRDAEDTLFGAWMSEGIRLEKGAYYGSGESCVVVTFRWDWCRANATCNAVRARLGSYGGIILAQKEERRGWTCTSGRA